MIKAVKAVVPLRRSLRRRVGVLVSGAVLFVGLGIYLFGFRPMVGRIAEAQFSLTASQVEASLDSVFSPAEQILKMSRGWIGDEPPELENPEAFNRVFRPVLDVLPQATSVVAGTSSGEGWMLLQRSDGSWLNRMTDRQRWGDRHLFFEQSADGVKNEYSQNLDYDARTRSWYIAALNGKDTVQWTAPYTFFTTGDPGITASTHLVLKDGRNFVVGLDLMLRDLSVTTMNARVGQRGLALVLTDDLRVLALPAQPDGVDRSAWLGSMLKGSNELRLDPLNAALDRWKKGDISGEKSGEDANKKRKMTAFRSNGEDWLLRMHPYRLGQNQLWVLTLAPVADFSPNWLIGVGVLLSGLALTLLLVALFTRQLATRIAQPLEALALASGRIARLDFSSEALEPSAIAEVAQLAESHEEMRVVLQDNQQLIAWQTEEMLSKIEALSTAEEKVRESEAYNKVLFSDSSIPQLVFDPESGTVIDCNQAAADIYGLPDRASVLNLKPIDVSASIQYDGTPSAQGIESILGKAAEFKSIMFEWRHRRPDGTEWDGEVRLMCFHHAGRMLFQFSLQDITERKKTESLLVDAERYQRALLDNFPFLVWLKDRESRFLAVNRRMVEVGGYESARQMIGQTDFDVCLPELAAAYRADDLAVMASGQAQNIVEHIVIDGKQVWCETYKSPVFSNAEVIGTVGFSRDISERKLADDKLKLAASVFTHAREGIMITTADGTIVDINETFCRVTGYSRDELIGQNPRLLKSERQEAGFYSIFWRDLLDKGHWYGEIWNRRKNGEIYPEMLTISAVCDEFGKPLNFVALCSDITALKEHERQLEHIAHYDVLTTLPNRVLMADRLHQAMLQDPRRGKLLAVVYLDLDGFKAINDEHGHDTGDRLLIALADGMKLALRESDTLARLGGDEFVAVLHDLTEVDDCLPMLERLLEAAARPVPLADLSLQVSASLGVTFYPQADDVDADQLLRQADQAMYQAKLAGKNRYHIFDADLDRSVRGHHESLEGIRRALTAREFVLYYQPKVNMRTGTVVGAEALIRWQHPERGLLPPAVFLPVVEDHPLAIEIGEWVIDTALTQMELWRAEGLDIPVSVNVGARQLQQPDFVARLSACLAAHPVIRFDDLELEVLETSALEDLSRVSRVIESCREIGVNFALDDFGTGYSSLTYLKRLSVAQLKIDQSFVRDMLDDPDDLAILGGVLSLATAFRRQVIAEGVETVEHGEMLLQLGCELAQGYGIARPMPAGELPHWVRTWHPHAAWTTLVPVDHDDLPLLFAGVEHRAWIVAVEAFLRGEREALPLIHHQCRFNVWLETDGQDHDEQVEFQRLERAHRRVHALADELCEQHFSGQNERARLRLHELYSLRDVFLAQLQVLVRGRKG